MGRKGAGGQKDARPSVVRDVGPARQIVPAAPVQRSPSSNNTPHPTPNNEVGKARDEISSTAPRGYAPIAKDG